MALRENSSERDAQGFSESSLEDEIKAEEAKNARMRAQEEKAQSSAKQAVEDGQGLLDEYNRFVPLPPRLRCMVFPSP